MKNNLFIFILFFTISKLCCQNISLKQIELDLQKSYQDILDDRFKDDTIAWNQLELHGKIFREKLSDYSRKYPSTLTYPFDSLRKKNIDIVSSRDKMFRIYSWDTWLGGTMHDFENIIQYKFGDKVYSKVYNDTVTDGEGEYIPFYSEIFTLKANNKTYYLGINNGIYSTKDASQSIKLFCIENDKLNDNVKLIKTKKGLVNSINVYFDFFSVVDRPERPLRLIKYDEKNMIIYIPIVLENGKVTNRFILYKFTGKYFEHIKTEVKKSNTQAKNRNKKQ